MEDFEHMAYTRVFSEVMDSIPELFMKQRSKEELRDRVEGYLRTLWPEEESRIRKQYGLPSLGGAGNGQTPKKRGRPVTRGVR